MLAAQQKGSTAIIQQFDYFFWRSLPLLSVVVYSPGSPAYTAPCTHNRPTVRRQFYCLDSPLLHFLCHYPPDFYASSTWPFIAWFKGELRRFSTGPFLLLKSFYTNIFHLKMGYCPFNSHSRIVRLHITLIHLFSFHIVYAWPPKAESDPLGESHDGTLAALQKHGAGLFLTLFRPLERWFHCLDHSDWSVSLFRPFLLVDLQYTVCLKLFGLLYMSG